MSETIEARFALADENASWCFPANAFHRVKSIRPFSTPLFLYHYGERKLYGAFEATCEAGMNLDRTAWVHAARAKDNLKRLRTGAAPSDGSPFPAQVRFQPRGARERLFT